MVESSKSNPPMQKRAYGGTLISIQKTCLCLPSIKPPETVQNSKTVHAIVRGWGRHDVKLVNQRQQDSFWSAILRNHNNQQHQPPPRLVAVVDKNNRDVYRAIHRYKLQHRQKRKKESNREPSNPFRVVVFGFWVPTRAETTHHRLDEEFVAQSTPWHLGALHLR